MSIGAAKNHCALYVLSPAVMETLKHELTPYATSKGVIRFPPDKPLPTDLVQKIVHARLAESEAAVTKSASKKASSPAK